MSKKIFFRVLDHMDSECSINQDTFKIAKAYSRKVIEEALKKTDHIGEVKDEFCKVLDDE